MEKINLLPVAEKTDDTYVYNDLPEKKDFCLDFSRDVYIRLLAGLLIGFLMSAILGVCVFGAILIILPLDKKVTTKINSRFVRNTFWNRLPFQLFGLTLIVFYVVCGIIEMEKRKTGAAYQINGTSMMIIKYYIAFIIAIIVGRLIYLIVTAFAIASRKKKCTVPVNIELSANYSQDKSRIFKYYYEGETYRFIDHEKQANILYNSLQREYDITPDHVYIDPNEPECYYSRQIFGYNSKKIKRCFVSLFLFLFFTSFFWIIPVFRYIVDHICA